ncbi:MarR family winged helix-turn-helix transcriptional regulator [Sphaerisporangium corydalis]|uniref:MarR family winged helix-turn-helix transcriptional regulator n=1 Tax=Sphaerisporangium corydalis TaxID=1441875 RepID=A0ABV9EMB1_9ACTN|nr:MarR family transcriptional regulator [Sphaerisporangium corydalis]
MPAEPPDREAGSSFELMTLMRRLNVELDRFVEQFATDNGLHRTDLNAVVVIMDAARAGVPLSPGSLGAALNLSAPATTALLNRLEQAGHVERTRSATDRRKVELTLHEKAVILASRFFTPLAQHLSASFAHFSHEDRLVIDHFLTGSIEATITARLTSMAGPAQADPAPPPTER